MSVKDCLKLTDNLDPDDLTNLNQRLKSLMDAGIPTDEAYTQAAELVMEDVLAERNQLAAEIGEKKGYVQEVTIENLLNPKSFKPAVKVTAKKLTETVEDEVVGETPVDLPPDSVDPESPGAAMRVKAKAEKAESVEYQQAIGKGLDMSKAARLKRAVKMGFDVATTLYHGTDANFKGFAVGSAPGWGRGVYLTNNPNEATEFGDKVIAAYVRITKPFDGNASSLSDSDVENTKIFKSMDKKTKEDYGDEANFDWNEEFAENGRFVGELLRELGFDGIIADRSNNIDGLEVVVFDPSNIRSVNAAFDPDYKDEANILLKRDGTAETAKTKADEKKHTKKVKSWVRKMTRRLNKRVPVTVLDTPADADFDIPADAVGYYHKGQVYLVASNIKTEAQSQQALEHEAIGHLGLEGALGHSKFNELIDDVNNIQVEILMDDTSHPAIRELIEELKAVYVDEDGNYALNSREEAREILAHIAHSKPRIGFVREIYNKISAWLGEWAAKMGYGDPDMAMIESMMIRATNYVRNSTEKYSKASEKDSSIDLETPNQVSQAANPENTAFMRKPTLETALNSREEMNRRIRGEHVTVWHKAKQMAKKYFTAGGLLPPSVFDAKITRDSELEAAEMDVASYSWALEDAFKKDFGIDYEKRTEAQDLMMKDALAGKLDENTPQATAVALEVMRQHMDGMSDRYLEILLEEYNAIDKKVDGEDTKVAEAKMALYELILGNQGEYVHRSYKVYDDPAWPKNVPDKILNNARNYLEAEMLAKEESALAEAIARIETHKEALSNAKSQSAQDNARIKFAKAESALEEVTDSMTTAEQKAARAQTIIEEMLKEGTAFDSFESFISESKLGAKDLSLLKKKKDIAAPILALLGEHTDARLNFARTSTKMQRLIFNDDFLKKVKEVGMGSFLFEDGDQPDGTWKTIAAKGNESYKPLNGLKTTPEINQAFIDALGKEQMEGWYRTIVQINGAVKFGKTVLSPTTAARNWMSASFFAMANGHFDARKIGKSLEVAESYFHNGKRGTMYLKDLKRLGVIYDTPYAGEMMKLLEDSNMSEKLLKGGMKGKHALDMAQKFYQFGDDFWKIVGFENEVALQMKHRGLTRAEAKPVAAERIRNTYPTYSMVGRAVNKLRRFPLAGTFVSFPSEIIRTSFHMVRYAAEDMKHSKELGTRRVIGLALVSSLAYAAQGMAKAMLGVDDDEDEAVRDQLPKWSVNSNIMYTSREDGKINYLDLSFADPYNIFKRALNALLRDEPIDKQVVEAGRELLSPFLGQDILFGTVMDIWMNKKDSGGKVFNPTDNLFWNTVSISDHLRKSLQPGAMNNIERTLRALNEEKSASGIEYNLENEMLALVGFRFSTLDPASNLKYRAYETQQHVKDAGQILNKAARDQNNISESSLKSAFNRSLKYRAEAYKDMLESISAAKKVGVNTKTIRQQLMAARVSKRDIAFLLKGKIPMKRPSKSFLLNDIKAIRSLLGAKASEKLILRRKLVFKWLREYRDKDRN